MPIVGGLDIHRKQLAFDYLDTVTGEVRRGQISPADREHLRAWLARFAGRDDVAFAMEGCTGWRYVAEEPADTAAARGRKRHAKTDKTDSRHLRRQDPRPRRRPRPRLLHRCQGPQERQARRLARSPQDRPPSPGRPT